MQLSSRFCALPALALAGLLAAPAAADVPSPEEEIRESRVAHWYSAYPGSKPAMVASLSPDGTAMLLRLSVKTPAFYIVRVDGKIAARGKVAALKGGVQTERISLAEHPGEKGVRGVHVDLTLRGVEAKDGVLRETGEEIAGCLRGRYCVDKSGGKPVLQGLALEEEDFAVLHRCGL